MANGVRLARLHYDATAIVPKVSGLTAAQGGTNSNPSLHVLLALGDHLGSTSTVLDKATSELVEKSAYLPFGAKENDYRPTAGTRGWNGFREDYGFTGKEEDVEVGLTYFGKRYLSPQLGRWISADPLAVHVPEEADFNLYAYVAGALLESVDPIGLDAASGRWSVSDDTSVSSGSLNGTSADLGLRISGPGASNSHSQVAGPPVVSPGRMQLEPPSVLKGQASEYSNAAARNYAAQGFGKFASLIENGYTCSACHSMFLTNGPPNDDQLDLQRYSDVQRPLNATTFGLMVIGAASQAGSTLAAGQRPTLFRNKFPQHPVDIPRQTFTVKQVTARTFNRRLNYVVTKDGTLRLGRRDSNNAGGGHIDLAGAEPVRAAGEVHIVGGKIRYVDNSSGHYEPSGASARMAAEKAFMEAGIDVSGKYVEKVWNGKSWVAKKQ